MEPFGKTKKTQCEEWVKRDNAVIAPCQHIPFYDLVVDEAKGDILVDLDNNHYVDFLSSASSLNIGSRRPEIVQAITEQMNKCIQFSPVYSYNVPMIEYAEELVKLFPQKEPGETIMLSYSNCGSEANDAAIKFCRGATKRSKIIAFTNSYHGNTYGSSTLSACTEKMHEGIGPLLPDVYHFPFYGIDVPDDECERDCLREIETAFRTYLPANEVAAVIIEPMQGDGGMLPAHHIFMRKLSSLCRENGILFIAEEVQLAFWRTGKCFSIEHYLEDDAYPDGIIMGKSVGGGLVLGAFMARESIIRSLESPAHIFTLAGNHLSCAAGLASLRYMQGNEYQEAVIRNSAEMERLTQELTSRHADVISFARGLGVSYGIGIVNPDSKEPDPDMAFKIVYRAYEKGLILMTLAGNVLRIQPPVNISLNLLQGGFSVLSEAISEVVSGQVPNSVLSYRRGRDPYISGV